MYEVDFARNIAYRGNKGFFINTSRQGIYIIDEGIQVFLTKENSKIMEVLDAAVTV